MEPNPCIICRTTLHLKAKWNSDTEQKWVHCDECGRISTPVTDNPLAVWNKENPKKDKQ